MNDGSFLVSDGYCNSRVLRYKPDGAFVAQYELPKEAGGGNGRGGSGMGVAHSVVVDECDGEVDVADREFGRVHRFDLQTTQLISELRWGVVVGGCVWWWWWVGAREQLTVGDA
jgi:peptidylamidoglycolate lyase